MSVTEFFAETLIPISICAVMPILIVWFYYRNKMHSTSKQTEIVLSAIERNSNIDVDRFFQKMDKPRTGIKQKLLKHLFWGVLLALLGVGFLGYGFYTTDVDSRESSIVASFFCFAIGVAFFVFYFAGRNMFKKELADEEMAETTDHAE